MNLTTTLFIKDCDKIDCAVWQPGYGIFGQTWIVDLSVTGTFDDNGFICDFGELKAAARVIIREQVDHKLLLPLNDDAFEIKAHPSEDRQDIIEITDSKKDSKLNRGFRFKGPHDSVIQVAAIAELEIAENKEQPNPEAVKGYVEQFLALKLHPHLPATVQEVKFTLREELAAEATFFRYTHGISGHKGHCQRLFHGHRSQIKIWVDGVRDLRAEQLVVDLLFAGGSVHILSEMQTVSSNSSYYEISYRALMGRFEGTVPRSRSWLIPNTTSIESISQEIGRFLLGLFGQKSQVSQDLGQNWRPGARVMVECFEGTDKGASADFSLG